MTGSRVERLSSARGLEHFRRDFPALSGRIWLNNGVVSFTPLPVTRYLASLFEEISRHGPPHVTNPTMERGRRLDSLQTIAGLMGCDAADLALMRGVTEGYLTVLRGIDWRPRDEILVSADEELALQLPAWHLRDRVGVVVKTFPLVDDEDGQLAAIDTLVGPRTRLLAFSQVTTDLGYRLPINAICEFARARDILTFVDTAHSLGIVPVDIEASGADFAGAVSYKWTYGPYGAGALFANRSSVAKIELRYAGNRAELSFNYADESYELPKAASTFQSGPWPWTLIHAWAHAIRYLQDIGLDRIEGRTESLATRTKTALDGALGIQLHTPLDPHFSAALIAVAIAGIDGEALAGVLRERWSIDVRPLLGRKPGIRASVSFFNTEDEIDLFVTAVNAVSEEILSSTN